MKKTAAIALFALLLLNVMGYYGIFIGLKYKNIHDTTIRLDGDDYSHSEAVTIKVPISIPYMQNTEFVRVTGEIEYNGEYYNLVKQKLSNDTLYVVCIRNFERQHIEQALTDYVKTFSDEATSSGQSRIVPSFIKDFLPSEIAVESLVTGWSSPVRFPELHNALPSHYPSRISPPPRA